MKNPIIAVIDGQGGRIGQMLCEKLAEKVPYCELLAIGTNSIATANMLKTKVVQGATGENPVLRAARKADVIVGPIGIVMADALLGEITPAMAQAIGQSDAYKVMIPVNRCQHYICGLKDVPLGVLIDEAVHQIISYLETA
ncbi:MAG: DUF3842 family protein [Erysipelotrichaceae bacterium]|nr:DUF3842 family protein [Erysipelotrichaceae bacterium]